MNEATETCPRPSIKERVLKIREKMNISTGPDHVHFEIVDFELSASSHNQNNMNISAGDGSSSSIEEIHTDQHNWNSWKDWNQWDQWDSWDKLS